MYSHFLHGLRANFAATQGPLFETTATGLFDAYLAALPDAIRQEHTCSCCRAFVKRFGGLVAVRDDGSLQPALWGDADIPEEHRAGVAAMASLVRAAAIKGPFLHSSAILGEPSKGGFTHMHVPNRAATLHTLTSLAARQRMAQLRENFRILTGDLDWLRAEHVEQGLRLMASGSMPRAERFTGALEFLRNVLAVHPSRTLMWRLVATAPDGFCRLGTTVVGELLRDIAAGLPTADVIRKFKHKVDSTTYQQPQAAPTAGAIQRAELLFAEMGLAPALARRYASPDELPAFWRPTYTTAKAAAAAPASVFGHVAPRTPAAVAIDTSVPAKRITWTRFTETVLDGARRIEVQVPVNDSRFVALVTAVDPQAPNLLAWGNPMSWYYAAGMGGEFRRRVEEAGGKYGDVDIRATLVWNNRNDLDLFVFTPAGERIYYGAKHSRCGGSLDIDRNVHGETSTPVENTRWPRGSARNGEYRIAVWNFNFHEYSRTDTPYQVELAVGDQTFYYDGVFTSRDGTRELRDVVRFRFENGRLLGFTGGSLPTPGTTWSGSRTWGLERGAWADVTGIVRSPNLWHGDHGHYGRHTFFLLEGCRDEKAGRGKAFFTEALRSDLREVRAVLEAHVRATEIGAAPHDVPACGLGFEEGQPWDVTVRVTAANGGMSFYNIDRHD